MTPTDSSSSLPAGVQAAEPRQCEGCQETVYVVLACPGCAAELCEGCLAEHVLLHGMLTERVPGASYLSIAALPDWAQWISSLEPNVVVCSARVAASLPDVLTMSPSEAVAVAAGCRQAIWARAVGVGADLEGVEEAIGALEVTSDSVYIIVRERETDRWKQLRWR